MSVRITEVFTGWQSSATNPPEMNAARSNGSGLGPATKKRARPTRYIGPRSRGLWPLRNPRRPGGIFRQSIPEHPAHVIHTPAPRPGLDGLLEVLSRPVPVPLGQFRHGDVGVRQTLVPPGASRAL